MLNKALFYGLLKVSCAWMNGNKLAKALAVWQQKVRVGIWCKVEVRHSLIYLTDGGVKPQENACAVFFLRSRDYTERRMKSSAPAPPLKPSSSARVSKHTLCSPASTRLDPVAPKLFYSFILLTLCRKSFHARAPNCESDATLLRAGQIFARTLEYSFSPPAFAPQKHHLSVSWERPPHLE